MTTIATSFSELEEQICQRFDSLSKRLRQVGRYLLDNQERVAFDTVAVIAEQADVPPSTLIRFARAFGFSGFNEMKTLFRAALVEGTSNYNERRRLFIELEEEPLDPESPPDILHRFAKANADALEQLVSLVNDEDLKRAVTILNQADTIHILAAGRSFNVGVYLAYALRHLGRKALLIDGLGGMFEEQVSMISAKDAVVAISFSPYASQTKSSIESISKIGCQLISLTDSAVSPLSGPSDVCFVIKEASVEGFRSQSATLCVTQTLTVSLAALSDKQD
ncbi:MurR/RpiR family transcriptional regulator [Veronia pacifica]|uniref:Fe-S cluster assembly protein HesB n=1 Tax=Veronia pacifica TaxID=1080227 RepID=A0A1C3EMP8_9GAMM|nr:MurR/RpiR family transcriptional regulator [Veronia pacifica]ODA34523.1 Fe-S cluster assembly protein HesB [Veronia pacifica]